VKEQYIKKLISLLLPVKPLQSHWIKPVALLLDICFEINEKEFLM